MATVTKAHRERAYACIWTDHPRPHERAWIEDGGAYGGDERMRRVAQALADLEARTARRAWCEGYDVGCQAGSGAGYAREDFTDENPYPEIST